MIRLCKGLGFCGHGLSSFIRSFDHSIPPFYCELYSVSIPRGSLTKGFRIATHRPSLELMSIVRGTVLSAGCLGWVHSVHFELSAVIDRSESVRIVVVDRLWL